MLSSWTAPEGEDEGVPTYRYSWSLSNLPVFSFPLSFPYDNSWCLIFFSSHGLGWAIGVIPLLFKKLFIHCSRVLYRYQSAFDVLAYLHVVVSLLVMLSHFLFYPPGFDETMADLRKISGILSFGLTLKVEKQIEKIQRRKSSAENIEEESYTRLGYFRPFILFSPPLSLSFRYFYGDSK